MQLLLLRLEILRKVTKVGCSQFCNQLIKEKTSKVNNVGNQGLHRKEQNNFNTKYVSSVDNSCDLSDAAST